MAIEQITVFPIEGDHYGVHVLFDREDDKPWVQVKNGRNVPFTKDAAVFAAKFWGKEMGYEGIVKIGPVPVKREVEAPEPVEVEPVALAAIICPVCGQEVERTGKRGRPATMHPECKATRVIEKTGSATVKVKRDVTISGRPSKGEQVYVYVVEQRAVTMQEARFDLPQHDVEVRLPALVSAGFLEKRGNKYMPVLVSDDLYEHRVMFRERRKAEVK